MIYILIIARERYLVERCIHTRCNIDVEYILEHNFRKYVPKGKSIENYSAEQILWFAEDMNSLPRKSLGYDTPDDLFEAYLDTVYAA